MGKHSTPEEVSMAGEVATPDAQPRLAIHRRGLDGEPYLAVSPHQRSTGPEFSKPGCQYAIGSIAVEGWQGAYRQHLLVSVSRGDHLAVITSRLYYPHDEPETVSVHRPVGLDLYPAQINFVDYDYRTSDADLLRAHRNYLQEAGITHFVEPTAERWQVIYDELLGSAIAASQ